MGSTLEHILENAFRTENQKRQTLAPKTENPEQVKQKNMQW